MIATINTIVLAAGLILNSLSILSLSRRAARLEHERRAQ